MQELQVTVDGVSYELRPPFMVMATQNPIEYEGTYPLPEAELDRFAVRVAIGYPSAEDEARLISEQSRETPLDTLEAVASAQDVLGAIAAAKAVFVEESVSRYVVAILRATRADDRLFLGGSPRAGITLLRVAKARALVEGRDHVLPEDVKAVAGPVLGHRLLLAPETRASGLGVEELVAEMVARVPVPA
jgi:MoxR-like ATPase